MDQKRYIGMDDSHDPRRVELLLSAALPLTAEGILGALPSDGDGAGKLVFF